MTPHLERHLRAPILAFLMLLYFGLVLFSSPRLSPAYDERIHIAAGLTMLSAEAYASARTAAPSAVDPLAPPIDVLPAIIARLHGRAADPMQDQWDGFEHIVAARWVSHIAGAVLVLLLFAWGESVWGLAGGVISAALLLFNPLFIGHATIVSTDLLAACGAVAVVLASWRFIAAHPPPLLTMNAAWAGRATGVGLACAFALVCKVSNLVFLVAPLLAVIHSVTSLTRDDSESDVPFEPRSLSSWIAPAAFLAMLYGVAFLGAGIAYDLARRSMSEQWSETAARFPVGKSLVHSLITATQLSGAHPNVFFGGALEPPSPRHFAAAFLLKTPLPILLGYLLVPIALILQRRSPIRHSGAPAFLLSVSALAAVFFATRGVYLGLRHMLPVIAILSAGGGSLALIPSLIPERDDSTGVKSPIIPIGVILLLWAAGLAVVNAPWHLAYFNPIGRREPMLADADGDWGEGLIGLQEWRVEHPGGDLFLAYFGNNRPELFGVEYRGLVSPYAPVYLDPQIAAENEPEKLNGYVALSLTQMTGVYFDQTGQDVNHFAKWLKRTPDWKVAGGGIWIFDCRKRSEGVAAAEKSR